MSNLVNDKSLVIFLKYLNVSIHLRSHTNNSSLCPTGISKHWKIMGKNTRASRSCIHHYFLVFGYPSETLAVHILLKSFKK